MARIRKTQGKKGVRYQAEVRLEGQSRTAAFRTQSEAIKWAGVVETEITKSKHPPPSQSKRKTVQDFMERYKASVISRQKDQRNPTRHADFWSERIGTLRLSRLNPAVLPVTLVSFGRVRRPWPFL